MKPFSQLVTLVQPVSHPMFSQAKKELLQGLFALLQVETRRVCRGFRRFHHQTCGELPNMVIYKVEKDLTCKTSVIFCQHKCVIYPAKKYVLTSKEWDFANTKVDFDEIAWWKKMLVAWAIIVATLMANLSDYPMKSSASSVTVQYPYVGCIHIYVYIYIITCIYILS